MEWTVSDKYVTMFMDYAIFIMTGQLGFKNSESGGTADVIYYKLTMSTKEQSMADASIKTVGKFTDAVHDYVDDNAAYNAVWVSGAAAVMVEISEEMNTQFLKIELTAIILIILLLFFVLKSYLTPIRSVVTIFMSVIWTVAITNLLFDDVMGEGVLWMLPIILLVICLGLGMDYDILLTTRIREYRFAKGMDNDESIHQAVLHSGSVITICGVIMAFTFGTLMLSNTLLLQQIGFALWFAILVDALIVRTYIVPAAMHLMGEWNWKGPAFLHPKRLPTTHEAATAVEHMEVHEYDAEGHLKE
jgi:RND superfamily putative drug exporter